MPFASSVVSGRKTRWSKFVLLCKAHYVDMAAAPALKVVLRAAIAHAIRASLLASAQATTLGCRRVSICRVQLTNGPEFLSSRCINALAHWTNSLRRFLSPLLLMPSKFVRPPVLY